MPTLKRARLHRVVKQRVFCERALTKENGGFGLSMRSERPPGNSGAPRPRKRGFLDLFGYGIEVCSDVIVGWGGSVSTHLAAA